MMRKTTFLIALLTLPGQGWAASLPPAKATLSGDGATVTLSGPFGKGSTAGLEAVVKGAPHLRRLALDSPGGSVNEARLTAQLVRRLGLDTYAADTCLSACTIVLFAGQSRWVGPDAHIGFHAYSAAAGQTAKAGQIEADENVERETYRRGGVPDWFIEHIFATPSSSVWLPTSQDLLRSNFVTGLAADGPHSAANDPHVVAMPATVGEQPALPQVIHP